MLCNPFKLTERHLCDLQCAPSRIDHVKPIQNKFALNSAKHAPHKKRSRTVLTAPVLRLQTLISLTAMYEVALLQGQPAASAAEFNTYAFIMLLMGTRQKDGPTAFFQVSACMCIFGHLHKASLCLACSAIKCHAYF